MKFSIRDLLWLTLVVALALGWLLLWRASPAPDGHVAGTVSVRGQPLPEGRVLFKALDGQIFGAHVAKGEYHIERVPVGAFIVSIEGSGVPTKYGDKSPLTVTVQGGRNQVMFDLTQ